MCDHRVVKALNVLNANTTGWMRLSVSGKARMRWGLMGSEWKPWDLVGFVRDMGSERVEMSKTGLRLARKARNRLSWGKMSLNGADWIDAGMIGLAVGWFRHDGTEKDVKG